MKKKVELLATAKDLFELHKLVDIGVDAIKVGHQRFGLRLPGDFELEMIEKAVQHAHNKKVKIYITVNGIFHNDIFEALEDYLTQLQRIGVDGIICGDPSIFVVTREHQIDIPIHWNPETLSTNFETLRYWQTKGIKRAVLANELSLANVEEISQQLDIETEVQVHGMSCIFQSKRELVTNYYKYVNEDVTTKDTSLNSGLFIKEFGKPDTNYPIYEDVNGTHIMSDGDICMIEHLDRLISTNVTSLRIDGLLKSSIYHTKTVRIYREAIDAFYSDPEKYQHSKSLFKTLIASLQPNERKLDTGFYFKEQIY